MSNDLVEQSRNAFDFVRKLYLETSYLIKEVEGLLQLEDESFVIGRPSGYAVTAKTSTGLESVNVEQWLPRTMTVFFCPASMTQLSRGQTTTPFSDSLRLLLLHLELFGRHLEQPRALIGYIEHVVTKKPKDRSKVEHIMYEFAYNAGKIFSSLPDVTFEDGVCSFSGHFLEVPLFSIRGSEDIVDKLIEPALELYRAEKP